MQEEPLNENQFVKVESKEGESKESGDVKVQISGAALFDGQSKVATLEKDTKFKYNVAEQFAGLPLGLLICSPIIEVAKGQAELCRVYLDTILRLAFEEGDKEKPTRLVKFVLTRPVVNGDTGKYEKEKFEVEAPLLSLVPIPAFTMEEATVKFTMEVKEQIIDKHENAAKATMELGLNTIWGFTAKITGEVTTKSEYTRTTDTTAKYEIFARAIQHPPAEGMAKLTNLFAATIEPMPIEGKPE